MDETRDDSKPTHPRVDISRSLGTAGHEVSELGFEGLPDSGAIEEAAEGVNAEEQAQSARDLALERAQFGLPRLPKD